MTTVTLPDSLVQEVEEITSQSLDRFIETTLRQEVARRRIRNGTSTTSPAPARDAAPAPAARDRVSTPARDTEIVARVAPVGAAGVLPDVDLTRWAAFIATDEGKAQISRALNG